MRKIIITLPKEVLKDDLTIELTVTPDSDQVESSVTTEQLQSVDQHKVTSHTVTPEALPTSLNDLNNLL